MAEEADVVQELFRFLVAAPGSTLRHAQEQIQAEAEELGSAMDLLADHGLVRSSPAHPVPVPVAPEVALARILEREEESLRRRLDELRRKKSILAALSENLMAMQVAGRGGIGVTLLEGEGEVVSALESAAVRARKEVLSMHPGVPLSANMLTESMERNHQALKRGVAMRSIHLDCMLRIPYGRAHLRHLQEAGAEVRVASVLPLRLIVVDGVLGYASTPPREGRFAALEFKGPEVVHVLLQMFEHCWVHGAVVPPLDEPVSRGSQEPSGAADAELDERERALVRMLAEGLKDVAIARSLGVSSRTLRRLMTDVMDRLEADSRFQAGARAMARGWLD
ncbi:LuxR C-terminal-related transcriptional regulator [Streptomyces sp. CC208A]|uniref:helix-turn-helix transcriptional regulator n=1 Tax=Streptomyces sp. CC208A TaxID=3044573 RepID=UPI0024A9D390|nr:LuxR C-terminal-related transcriptional regulator [Streptomyces sp. CC208A]